MISSLRCLGLEVPQAIKNRNTVSLIPPETTDSTKPYVLSCMYILMMKFNL